MTTTTHHTHPRPAPTATPRSADGDITAVTPYIEILARRWALQIIAELAAGPLRRSRLRDRLDGVSEKVLTDRLRDLEDTNLVTRAYYPGTPPRVDYGLTRTGHTVTIQLANLYNAIRSE